MMYFKVVNSLQTFVSLTPLNKGLSGIQLVSVSDTDMTLIRSIYLCFQIMTGVDVLESVSFPAYKEIG